MPTLEELDAYYQNEYRTGEDELGASPYEDADDVNFRTRSQLECIQILGLKPRSIVDVGCGFGLLIKGLRHVFPEARLNGIEVSTKCHPALRQIGIDFTSSPLEREGQNPFSKQFDLLTCSHVLEHSCDPLKFLSVCRTMLRPGGTAMFEVPNCEYEYGTDVPHVIFFTPATLEQVLERSEFSTVKCRACGPSIDRWLPSRGQRLRNFVDDYFPPSAASVVKAGWRLARTKRALHETSSRAIAGGLAKLREEAKDQAWFQYDQPGFHHSAIRCVAVCNP